MAIKANLVVDQGTDFEAKVDLTTANNDVFDLTGYSVFSQMRKNYASSTATSFTTLHNDTGGQITLRLSSTLSATLEPGRYLYDVEIVSPGGNIDRVVEGIVTVTPGITR